jgi:hypothetical protein
LNTRAISEVTIDGDNDGFEWNRSYPQAGVAKEWYRLGGYRVSGILLLM